MSTQLTEQQKKTLRGQAHSLKPVVTVGDKGITDALIKELDQALEHHELLKVKVRAGDRDARDAAIQELGQKSSAMVLGRIGNIATLFRQRKKDSRFKLA